MRAEVHRVRIGAALVCVTLCAAAGEARVTDQDESAGGVLVQTQMPQRGSMPATVLAYGLATPAVNGGMTLSVQAEGRVQHIDVTAGEAVQAGRPLLEFQLSAAASSSYTQAVAALKLAQEQRARTARLLEQQSCDARAARAGRQGRGRCAGGAHRTAARAWRRGAADHPGALQWCRERAPRLAG